MINQEEKASKILNIYNWPNRLWMPNSIPRPQRRSDLQDKPRENIVGVVHVRVALDDERVAALGADGVQRLALAHHIYLVARPLQDLSAPDVSVGVTTAVREGLGLPQAARQHKGCEDEGAVQRSRMRRGYH